MSRKIRALEIYAVLSEHRYSAERTSRKEFIYQLLKYFATLYYTRLYNFLASRDRSIKLLTENYLAAPNARAFHEGDGLGLDEQVTEQNHEEDTHGLFVGLRTSLQDS